MFRIWEPRSDPGSKWWGYKFNGPAYTYELAIAVHSQRLVWIAGPYPAGAFNDRMIYNMPGGLKSKIPDGKLGIADRGYTGEDKLATHNPFDSKETIDFKKRARARHETLNGRIKNFKVLDKPFRHGVDNHKVVFEAVCVIVQYELENGHPLFNV
jgi:hypothetical protein